MKKEIERRDFLKKSAQASALLLTGIAASGLTFGNGSALEEEKEYNILDFGAVSDGTTLNTSAIQKAIDKCAKAGGGKVIVPKGTFLTGGFKLQSHVEFHLEEGAVILGSPYLKDYTIINISTDVRYSNYLRYALVSAQGTKNIIVSGKGTLNGNGQLGGQLNEFIPRGKGGEAKRPCLLWFDECENVLVKEITYTNSAMWTETYSRCKNVHVDGITVTENYFYNADGCNFLDCEDFIVENCNINALDDGICLKGYTNTGCIRGIIRNNKVRSICNGIKMGTDSSGGFRDILIENNEIWETGLSGLALEIVDGGTMENITVQNLKMNVVGTPVFIVLSDRSREVLGDMIVPRGIIRNVNIRGIQAIVDKYKIFNELEKRHFDFIPYASSITGFPGQFVEDVVIEDIDVIIKGGFPKRTAEDSIREIPEAKGSKYPENRMYGILPAFGFYIRHVRGLKMQNINLSIEQEDGRPAILMDDVHSSVFNNISVQGVTSTPAFSVMKNCSGIQLP